MDNKTTLYLECRSGISGDMTVAALLDLGATEENLRRTLAKLPVGGYEIKVQRLRKNGLDVCDFDVILRSMDTGILSTAGTSTATATGDMSTGSMSMSTAMYTVPGRILKRSCGRRI